MNGSVQLIRLSDYHHGMIEKPAELDTDGLMLIRFLVNGKIFDINLNEDVLSVHCPNGRAVIILNTSNDFEVENVEI